MKDLLLVGTCHIHPEGRQQLKQLLENTSPESVGIENPNYGSNHFGEMLFAATPHKFYDFMFQRLNQGPEDSARRKKQLLLEYIECHTAVFGYELEVGSQHALDYRCRLVSLDLPHPDGRQAFLERLAKEEEYKLEQRVNLSMEIIDECIREGGSLYDRERDQMASAVLHAQTKIMMFLRKIRNGEKSKQELFPDFRSFDSPYKSEPRLSLDAYTYHWERNEHMAKMIRKESQEGVQKMTAIVGALHLPPLMHLLEDLNPRAILLWDQEKEYRL